MSLCNNVDMTSFPDSSPPAVTSTRWPFVALLIAVLSFSLLQTMVVPALPDLQREFSTSPSAISWILSSFLLTSSVGTVILGRLGDMFGKRRLMLISLGILGLGTAIAALSGSIGMLIAGRAVQGLGAATFPLAFGLVRDLFERERVPVAIGTISAMFGIGFGVGLVIPGPIVDWWGWQWIFWVTLIVIVIALCAVAAFIDESTIRSPGRIDWLGAALLTVGLAALLLAISQSRTWGAGAAVGLLVLAVVALAAFAIVELRIRQPLIDLPVLGKRSVLTANTAALIIGFGMYGAFTLVPQLVQTPASAGYGFGATVTESGLFLLPMAVTMLFAGPVAGRLGARVGFKPTLVLACALGVAGFVFFALGDSIAWAIAIGAGILGIGIGFAFSSLANVVVASVDPHETGQATGVNTILRTIGGSIGAQASAAIVSTSQIAGTRTPAVTGYTVAFTVSAIAMAAAGLVALAAPARRPTGAPRKAMR
jgi:EmrB/QacA subfamily drug resistance transporter